MTSYNNARTIYFGLSYLMAKTLKGLNNLPYLEYLWQDPWKKYVRLTVLEISLENRIHLIGSVATLALVSWKDYYKVLLLAVGPFYLTWPKLSSHPKMSHAPAL